MRTKFPLSHVFKPGRVQLLPRRPLWAQLIGLERPLQLVTSRYRELGTANYLVYLSRDEMLAHVLFLTRILQVLANFQAVDEILQNLILSHSEDPPNNRSNSLTSKTVAFLGNCGPSTFFLSPLLPAREGFDGWPKKS